MADIRKRTGKNGTTYQVRYATKATKSGYAFRTFDTLKEARAFTESGEARSPLGARDPEVRTIAQAVDKWLAVCVKEGREGRDPITKHTEKTYGRRAEVMKSYDWGKSLQEIDAPDVVEFRSWLLAQQ